jgi:hypothetical protein
MSMAGDPVAISGAVDLTTVALQLVSILVVPTTATILGLLVNRYVKDKDAAAAIQKAIANSAGYAQATIGQVITTVHPTVALGLTPNLQQRLQYVLDHAAPEIERLYKSTLGVQVQEFLAQKVVRQQGMEQLAVNPAAAEPVAVPALIPVAVVGDVPPASPVPITTSTRNTRPQ